MRKAENSSRERFVTSRYAALAEFVALTNLLEPTNDSLTASQLESLDPEVISVLESVWRVACRRFGPRPSDPPAILAQTGGAEGIVVLIRGDDPNRPYALTSPIDLYVTVRTVRDALRALATTKPGTLPIDLPLQAGPARVQVRPDGRMLPGLDLRDFFLPALAGGDVRRIKICPASGCGRLFMATRRNKASCSDACANRLKAARFRKDHASYYTAEERQKRADRNARRKRRIAKLR
jgi:hypothetical protein